MFGQIIETRGRFLILAWGLLAAIACVCLLCMSNLGLTMPWRETIVVAGAIAVLLVIGRAYAERAPRISEIGDAAAYLFSTTIVLGIASYVAAASGGHSLWDGVAHQIDRSLGFDWLAQFNFMKARPVLLLALGYSYDSTIIQPFIVILALTLTGQRQRLRIFLLCYVFCAAVVVALFAIFPMLGAFEHYLPGVRVAADVYGHIVGPDHLEHLQGLRNGSMKALSIADTRGLVSFPSFHTVMSVLLAWALARTPFLRGPSLVLNAVVILSTLSIGGHYLCDVIAGAFIAAASIALCSVEGRRQLSHGTLAATSFTITPQAQPR